jgi:hypothetical protein
MVAGKFSKSLGLQNEEYGGAVCGVRWNSLKKLGVASKMMMSSLNITH